MLQLRSILVPTDFSPFAPRALDEGLALARAFDARLTLLHVVEVLPAPGIYGIEVLPAYDLEAEMARQARDRLDALAVDARWRGLNVETHVEIGRPPRAVLDFMEHRPVDLVVMASHGHSGIDRFLMGSVAEKVIRSAPCPVLVVKPSGKRLDGRADLQVADTAEA